MKVAVYAICKNEEKHVDRFMESASEADVVVVLDTGSTDKTVELFKKYPKVQLHQEKIEPWHFANARNRCLELVPEDVDIVSCQDLDEVMSKGWCEQVKKEFESKPTHRLKCKFIWSFKNDGTPDRVFFIERIHTRKDFYWKHAVHEYIYWKGEGKEQSHWADGITMEHHPDPSKSRGSYLGLLERVREEEPDNDRNSHYLGREYVFVGQWDKGIAELKRHLSLHTAKWDTERAASCRFIAQAFKGKKQPQERIRWLLRAVHEDGKTREPWMDLAQAYYDVGDFHGCYWASENALRIQDRQVNYITEAVNWGDYPHDLYSLGCWNIGLKNEARKHAIIAMNKNRRDERLRKNVEEIERAIFPDKSSIPFLITGFSRSGTKYTAELLRSIGLDVGHEVRGRDGIVSWVHLTGGMTAWLGRIPLLDYRVILHQVRHPLRVIASFVGNKCHIVPARFNAAEFMSKHISIPQGASPLRIAMESWLRWNELAEKKSVFTFRVESIQEAWPLICSALKVTYREPSAVATDTNHREDVEGLTWDCLYKEDRTLAGMIEQKAKQYGYQL